MPINNPFLEKKVSTDYMPVNLNPQGGGIEPIDLSGLKAPESITVPDSSLGESSLGGKALGQAGNIMKFSAGQYNKFKTVSGSSDEALGETVSSGMEAAQIGLMLGGPVGAGVGAVVGAGLGLLDASHDKKVRIDKADKEARQSLLDIKDERKNDYLLSQGKKVSTAQNNLTTKQSDILKRF